MMDEDMVIVKVSPDYEWLDDLSRILMEYNSKRDRMTQAVEAQFGEMSTRELILFDGENHILWSGRFKRGNLLRDFDYLSPKYDLTMEEYAIIEVVNNNYFRNKKQTVLTLYYSLSCIYCERMIDIVHELAGKSEGFYIKTVNITEVDINELSIRGVPTVFYEKEKFVGVPNEKGDFYDWLYAELVKEN